ncbi:phage tail spike protein [Bacillus cereus]|uniref:phage tail spike protein n=1 Tax=Bacillus paranthracis TaxID=2026186 RepID=UPI00254F9DE2|nr:phage tail spike protein [Bacillus paranthracis]MDK7418582.1 phage tail protein [Bacillus paranthracis]MDK7430123.1 phage tail protein [Bacillus paranthracis]MDK7440265.1 phage tail protein [Bacillus paranthracis]MDK7457086.1 phage tail protein [Bacillus paranthracis]MDK7519070.1 phage tail protein [Bacillus paranthracis]
MRTPSGELHVVDFKTEQIVASIQPKDYWEDKRHWEIKNNIDTLEFRVFDNTRHSSTLMQQNLVLKEVRDGRIVPYVITEVEKNSDDRSVTAYASGEWIQLAKAGIIPPQKLEGKTVIEMVDIALAGTKWKKGDLEYASFRSMTIDEFIDPLSFLKKIASLFELEIQYRAEVVGSQVIGRYVDMVKKRGRETGKEITLGKDLLGIKRIENSQNICTALLGFVKKEGGEFVTIAEINGGVPYLVDSDAFQRWNEKGNHKFGFYSPETENEDMDAKRLMTLMKTELAKRVNTSVFYEVEAQSIGRVFGLSHELINEGDTIRIKDTGFTPKLYLEGRAIAGDESFKNPLQDKYVFGDYHEIVDPNEELRKIYNRILSSLGNKQEMIDQLDKLVKEANETASNAKKESEAAKTLAEKVQENIKNNTVEIIEAKNPPTTGLIDRKTLWLDISNGKPGILKLWKDGVWDPVVPDIESVKNEVAGQFNKVNDTLQGFSRNIIDLKNDQGVIDKKVTSIEQTASGLSSSVYNLNNIVDEQGKKLTEANSKIEQQATAIGAKVELKQVEDYVAGFQIPELKQTVNQNMEDLLDELANKLATEQFNQKMTLIDNRFTLNEKGIDLAAKKSEVYTRIQADGQFAKDSYVRDLEGRIQVTEKNILSTVKNGEIISAINQTAETIKISAGKIQLDGTTIAKYLEAQELRGTTIRTDNGINYVHIQKQFIRLMESNISRVYLGYYKDRTSQIQPTVVLGGDSDFQDGSVVLSKQPTQGFLGVINGKDSNGDPYFVSSVIFKRSGDLNLNAGMNGNVTVNSGKGIGHYAKGGSFWAEATDGVTLKGGTKSVWMDCQSSIVFNLNGKNMLDIVATPNAETDLRFQTVTLRNGNVDGYKTLQVKDGTGNAFNAVTAAAFQTASKREYKTNIRDVQFDAIEKIMALKIQQYNLKTDVEDLYEKRMNRVEGDPILTTNDIETHYGWIADDENTPGCFVTKEKNAAEIYSSLAIQIEAFQKEKLTKDAEIEELNRRIEVLEQMLFQNLIDKKSEQP